jgi:CDP-paratose 2-epimerase
MKKQRNGKHEHNGSLLKTRTELPTSPRLPAGKVLITGGAGFIGSNLAERLLCGGVPVVLLDNLSRPGVERNLAALQQRHGSLVEFVRADVRERAPLRQAVRDVSAVFHFAAQVAVTTSLVNPLHDHAVNVGGTVHLLEELRQLDRPPTLLFTSTNKVYGALDHVPLHKDSTRYEPAQAEHRLGTSEAQRLDFHSPYGCSKGAADQYVLDAARSFGLPTVVFRMSCIYGPHQCGTEDQGWVAHFLLCALKDQPLTLYGDGLQVRDILFVEDLVNAFLLAHAHIDRLQGQAFNIGGGADNTISLRELLDLIRELHGSLPPVRYDDWRTGDQRYYVSDIRRFRQATGWLPRVGVRAGVTRLYHWLQENTPGVAEPLVAGGKEVS